MTASTAFVATALVAVAGACSPSPPGTSCTPPSGWSSRSLGVAGCYLVLSAELVALVLVLVYVGAVVVLLLFALMLTRAPIGPDLEHAAGPLAHRSARPCSVPPSAAARSARCSLPPRGGPGRRGRRHARPRSAGQLFGTWVRPFELLSLLLLAALVAASRSSRSRGTRPARTGRPSETHR